MTSPITPYLVDHERLAWARAEVHRDALLAEERGLSAAEWLETEQAEMEARGGVIPQREVEAVARMVWRLPS